MKEPYFNHFCWLAQPFRHSALPLLKQTPFSCPKACVELHKGTAAADTPEWLCANYCPYLLVDPLLLLLTNNCCSPVHTENLLGQESAAVATQNSSRYEWHYVTGFPIPIQVSDPGQQESGVGNPEKKPAKLSLYW